ncbi:MAG TPA: SAM-dependent methyltransferase [Fimbriimonas sp.]|nr:SAM-dependent methyltransferase [Fimbriimonas sp.]
MIKRNRVLVTCDADSQGLLLEELRRSQLCEMPGSWLDTGDAVQGSILLIETELDFDEFSDELERFGSVFVRHLAPVELEMPLKGSEEDLGALYDLLPGLIDRLDPHGSFSVQSRILGTGKLPYRKVTLNESLSQAIEEATRAVMDCRKPDQVVSLLCSPTTAYLGVSRTQKNRSEWPGGKHRFKKDDDQISRAEFKLLEAFSVFGVDLPSKGRALDIGASPGGWSRILAERGLNVDAVDPGELDPRLANNRRIAHHRRRIQEYSAKVKRFDVIVNDMKMDARDSIEIMLAFAPHLTFEGVAVITLKMPKTGTSPGRELDMIWEDFERLSTCYRIVGARQLYHNRSEITVVLEPQARKFGYPN